MFVLKTPNLDAESLVYLLYGCQDGQLKLSMKVKVHPKNFKGERGTGKYAYINQTLNRVAAHIDKLENDRRVTGKPILKHQLREDIANIHSGKFADTPRPKNPPAKKSYMIAYIDGFIYRRKHGIELTKRNKRFSANTIKNYTRTRNHLEKFGMYLGQNLTFEMVDLDFRATLINWLHEEYSHSLNAVGHSIRNLKVFITAAYRDKIHTNTIFMDAGFFAPAEEATDVYLTDGELKAMQDVDLSNGYAYARDWFLIECYTGLRVSDVKRLTADAISGGYISLATEKTNEKVVLPVHPVVSTILARWDGLPPPLSDQKINAYIKEVAARAGIDAQVLHTITRAGERQDTYLKKWQMIGNHTGRRTFITNLVKQKIPDQLIMRLTGIKKSETLKKYNKLSPEDAAEVARGLPFFKG